MKIDISDCKNLTAKKAKIRTQMTELLMEFLKEKFEDVEGDVLQVGTNERLTTSDISEVHLWQFLDCLNRNFFFRLGRCLISVTHRTSCIATICNNDGSV